MKLQRRSGILAFAMALALPALGQSAERASEVRGQVTLVSAGAGVSKKDASRVVVWLTPVSDAEPVPPTQRPHYRLRQRDKRFEPGLLVVPVGSVVDFPNADPWFHNVFSLYRGKRFDLGLYQAGAQRSVRFDRPGPSYLFCNIHPEMTGVILAVESELFALTDKNGRYALAGIAPGKYLLHVWYENAAPELLEASARTVNIEALTRPLPVISIAVTVQSPTEHKNKYGQDYDPDTLKTDY